MSELAPRSYNEIRFFVTRAAIGAGLPYSLAECLGSWAMRLAVEGIEPVRACASVLNHLTDGLVDRDCSALLRPDQTGSEEPQKTRSVVYVAPVVCDWINVTLTGQHPQKTWVIDRIDCPELLVAAIAGECGNAPGVDVACSQADHQIVVWVSKGGIDGTSLKDLVDQSLRGKPGFWEVQVHLSGGTEACGLKPPDWQSAYAKGIAVDSQAWPVIESLFSRSLVPSSDQSLLGGAGAGLQDND